MIELLSEENIQESAEMANRLWPDSEIEELVKEFRPMIASSVEACFLYKDTGDRYVGFIQTSIRSDYVEGSHSSPVAYIEGIYVEEGCRRKGVARSLMHHAEVWGKQHNCTELASDCELDNLLSIDVHGKLGFEEANRIVCFIKKLG